MCKLNVSLYDNTLRCDWKRRPSTGAFNIMLLRVCIFCPRGILCIHPSFRIIGLAEPPVVGSSQQQWLNSELLSVFLFHHVRPLSKQEEAQVIYDMVRERSQRGTDIFAKHVNFSP